MNEENLGRLMKSYCCREFVQLKRKKLAVVEALMARLSVFIYLNYCLRED